MPKPSAPLGYAEREAQKLAQQLHLQLIDVELVKESTGRFLRFYIDKEGENQSGVTLDDCEAFHRRIQPLMENVDYDYMEVSSPGADRPLKKDADFERARGEMVEIHLFKPIGGAKRHAGTLVALAGSEIVIADAGGTEMRFDRKAVSLVKPLIEFDEESLMRALPDNVEAADNEEDSETP